MEDIELNFENICRTCLSRDMNLQSAFEVQISDLHTVRMVDFIRRMTSIKIARGDGLPQNLCVCCIDIVCKAYNFVQQCVASETFLKLERKRFALQNIQKEVLYDECTNLIPNEEYVEECNLKEEVKLKEIEEQYLESNAGLNGFFDNSFEIIVKNDAIEDDLENCKEEPEDNVEALDNIANVKTKRNYQCATCYESFNTKFKLASHSLLHKPYKCEECLKTFSKSTHLNVHMRSHIKTEDKQFMCQICGQKFVYSYLLKQHAYKHSEEKPFPCTKCKKGCLTAESLRRHMKTHEESYEKKQHVCLVCSKKFPYPSFLAEHMKNHTGEKPFLCSVCGKGFRQSGALEYHIRSHTGFKPYKCQTCNNQFTSRGGLRVHMRRHTDERPFVCDICGMAFRQSADMNSHRRTHTGDKRALCTVCGKRMSTTGQLTVHLRSHTGEKPFNCSICCKAFSTRTMLVKHQRIHTGERPYICNVCGKSFNQSSTLKTHSSIHKKQALTGNGNGIKKMHEKLIFEVQKDKISYLKTYCNVQVEETKQTNKTENLTILPPPILDAIY